MQLFDVKDVDGCIPAMNELFNRFLKHLRWQSLCFASMSSLEKRTVCCMPLLQGFGELNMLHKIVRDHLGLPSSGVVTVTDTVRAMEGGFGADWGNDF